MKKNRFILIVCACMCVVLSGVVLAIAFWQTPVHKHKLGEARTYHVYNDHVYYTRQCQKDDHQERFNMNATFIDIINNIKSIDKIVLEENIILNSEITLKSYQTNTVIPQGINLRVNIDLNDKLLSTNYVLTKQNNSMFMLDSTYGSIEFNVKNGSIYSQGLSYIFNFKTREGNVKLNIENVECKVLGVKATPIYAHNANVKINASGSKFISNTTTNDRDDFGVGVFINSDNIFSFDECCFEGGDAVYVRQGTINLTDCILQNKGLMAGTVQSIKSDDNFAAVGSCLATESYTSNTGTSKFVVNILGCKMYAQTNGNSDRVIYVFRTASSGYEYVINPNSAINILSCIFDQDPAKGNDWDLINYPNDTAPQVNQNEQWICGNISQ